MTRFLSAITTLALVASLGAGAAAKDKVTPGHTMHGTNPNATKMMSPSMHASTMGKTMSTSCAPGKKYVKGYTKKDGTKVKGYCR